MQCPQCGTQNDESFRFCMKCGSPLPVPDNQPVPQTDEIVEETAVPVRQPAAYTPSPQPIQPPPYQPPAPASTISQGQYQPTLQPQYSRTQQSYPGYPPNTGAGGISILNIWGPFAGYGTRRRHVGWLMDDKGDHAQELIQKISTKFAERKIPETYVQQKTLAARGVIVENRPYFILQRGLVSVGLHITQFGRDLFISLASYLKPPISNFRVLLLGLMALFWLYYVLIYPGSVSNAFDELAGGIGGGLLGGSTPSTSGLFTLLCVIGPLGLLDSLLLFLFLAYSGFKWMREKDFIAGLRVQPNEFNEDDLMAMEKAVEQTVRMGLDEIGLNPDDLKPASSSDRQRLI